MTKAAPGRRSEDRVDPGGDLLKWMSRRVPQVQRSGGQRLGREPKPMSVDYQAAVRDHLIDLLYVDEKLAGLVKMVPGTRHLLVENVAVSPAFQDRGYGTRLMAHAEQVAASLGRRELRLYTNRLFIKNVQFYLGLGYRVNREEAFKGGFLVHMSKHL